MKKATLSKAFKSRTEDITPEEVLATEELQHLNREQAEEIVEFIKTYSGICLSLFQREMEMALSRILCKN